MSKELQFDNGDIQIELCAKCGNMASVNDTGMTDKSEYLYWCECCECNNRTMLCSTVNKAIKIWNKKQEIIDNDIGL